MNRKHYIHNNQYYILDYTGNPVLPEGAVEIDEKQYVDHVLEIESRNRRIKEERQRAEEERTKEDDAKLLAQAEKLRNELLSLGFSVDNANVLARVVYQGYGK